MKVAQLIAAPSHHCPRLVALWAGILGIALGLRAEDPVLWPVEDQVLTSGQKIYMIPFRVTAPRGDLTFSVSIPAGNPAETFVRVVGLNSDRYVMVTRPQSEAFVATPAVVPVTLRMVVPGAAFPDRQSRTQSIDFRITIVPPDLGEGGFVFDANFLTRATVVVPGDFNGDGALDLMTSGPAPGVPAGRSLLTTQLIPVTMSGASGALPMMTLAAGGGVDANGDGLPDLLAITGTLQPILLENAGGVAGTQGFRARVRNLPLTGLSALDAAWVDLDSDGLPDLVVAAAERPGGPPIAPRCLLNRGVDGWVAAPAGVGVLPPAAGPFVAADFNGDGYQDLFIANLISTNGPASVLMLNEGNGRFHPSGATLPAGTVRAAGWTDLNADGTPDLWLMLQPSTNSPTELRLLVQRAGAFTESQRIPIAPYFPALTSTRGLGVAFGDFNQDGRVDFVTQGTASFPVLTGDNSSNRITHPIVLWHQEPDGTFRPGDPLESETSPGYFSSLTAADMNRDGRLDLITAFSDTGTSGVLLNRSGTVNLPPGRPTGLVAAVLGDWVFFTWQAATDPNQTAPLTYNLRVGTKPGSNNLMPSNSRSDGLRLVPGPGNTGYNRFQMLHLDRANSPIVYWSVQAVDASGTGGGFAPESTLALDSAQFSTPGLAGLPATLSVPPGAYATLPFQVTDSNAPKAALKVTVASQGDSVLVPSSLEISGPPRDGDPGFRQLTVATDASVQGTNRLTVTVSNGYGKSVQHQLELAVTEPPPVTSGTPLTVSAGPATLYPSRQGTWTLRLKRTGGLLPSVESSFNLTEWKPVTLALLPAVETLEGVIYEVPSALAGPSQFLRVSTQGP